MLLGVCLRLLITSLLLTTFRHTISHLTRPITLA